MVADGTKDGKGKRMRMAPVIILAAAGMWAQASLAATDAKAPVLLELFTSEGCSSCPPADRLLQSLDEKQPFAGAEVLVLSEHVDYWNNGGWVDPYSSRVFSERQRQYAEQFGLDGAYTPQLVVDGQREAVGSNAAAIKKAVDAVKGSEKVALTLSNVVREGGRVKFHLTSADLKGTGSGATAYVALAEGRVESSVAGGENGGRALTHVAVVRLFSAVGTVQAGGSFSKDLVFKVPPHLQDSGLRVVAFLQNDKSHKVVGVTQQRI